MRGPGRIVGRVSKTTAYPRYHRRAALPVVVLAALLLVACTGGATDDAIDGEPASSQTEPTEPRTADPGSPGAPATPAVLVDSGLPVGPAVTVEQGYEPPNDHVPSTGAHLPANGKPTLVYVDAIW